MVWRGRIRWRLSILASLSVLVILLPQAVYSRSSPFPVLNHAWVEGWSPANFARHEFTNIDGHFNYEKINGLFYAQPFYDPYYLAPIFAPFMLVGVFGLLKKRFFVETLFLVGWIVLPYLFLAGIPYQNIRFPLIFFPAIAVFVGLGFDSIAQYGKQLIPGNTPYHLLQIIAVSVFIIWGLGQMFMAGQTTVSNFIAVHQRDKAAAAWTAEQVPPNETLYTFGLTLTLRHYTPLNVYEIYYETPQTLRERWETGEEDYLLVNVWNIENQWAGREPQIAYHWLRDERGLIELGRYGNYTLFRISG